VRVGAQPNVSRYPVLKHREFRLPTTIAVLFGLGLLDIARDPAGRIIAFSARFGPWAGRNGED
jgi:hypothetical protein